MKRNLEVGEEQTEAEVAVKRASDSGQVRKVVADKVDTFHERISAKRLPPPVDAARRPNTHMIGV